MFRDNGTPPPVEESAVAGNDPIAATQRWMEDFIIAKGVCPPLVRLAKDYRNPDGTIDWNRMSEAVVTENATHLTADPNILAPFLTDKFIGFMEQAYEGTAPMALSILLPDVKKNEDYKDLVFGLKMSAVAELTATPERQSFAQSLYREAAKRNSISEAVVEQTVNDGPTTLAMELAEGIFNPVYFHGQKLSRKDLDEYTDELGPKTRFRVLARAPYYTIQFLNAVDGPGLYAQLNRQTVYKHNNRLVAGIEVPIFEAEMKALRKTK